VSALAKFRAQFFQHRRCARYRGAADFEPLELDEQAAACLRGQVPQVVSKLVALRHDTGIRNLPGDRPVGAAFAARTSYEIGLKQSRSS